MFLRRAEPRSIASQLIFLFALAAGLLLCCGLAVLYWIVVRHALEEDREVLADKVFAVRAALNTAGGPKVIQEELKSLRPGERAAYWVRIVDWAGGTVAETPGMERLLPSSLFPPPPSSPRSIMTPKDYRTGAQLFSLVTVREKAASRYFIIEVAQDRSADARFTKQFGMLVAVVLAFGTVASGLIAFTVTKRGLLPLAELTRSLQRVGANHLKEKVPLAGWPRELQPLAVAFDEMLDRLENSFARLSQFSADLAHELRTPIANIRGESEVALTRPRSPNEYRDVIESTVAECERLSGIIDNLLFLARAEAAEAHIQRTFFDGRAAIEKIAIYYRTIAEERRVAINCTGEGDLYADPLLFGRAISNLVDNALRFTPDGGMIWIAIASSATQTEVSVSDTGRGIAGENISRVFDRFYRADASRSSQGTGLGLALVKSITDLHRGSARVESKVDRGTIVTLTFPKAEIEASDLSPRILS